MSQVLESLRSMAPFIQKPVVNVTVCRALDCPSALTAWLSTVTAAIAVITQFGIEFCFLLGHRL
jgi:hypothetical protein